MMNFFRRKTGKALVAGVLVTLTLALFYKSNYVVPVLMYHQVDYGPPGSGVHVTPENFERQMEFLKVHGYHVVPLEQVFLSMKEGRPLPLKSVAITFDDGFLDNIKYAFPVLKKMNFPATVFMITRNINTEQWLSEEDLRILHEGGISIGSHTVSHAFLPDVGQDVAAAEISESKKRLEAILGAPVELFSYPAGGVTWHARSLVEKEGYLGAVTTNYGKRNNDPYLVRRIKVSNSSGNLFNFWIKTSGLYHLGKKRITPR